MAEELDVLNACADQAAPIAVAISGAPYQLTGADAAAYGATQNTPDVIVRPGWPILRELQDMHDRGGAVVAFNAEKHDAPTTQYVNDRKRSWVVSRDPLTLSFTQAGKVVTLSGTLTAGNVMGAQFDGATSVGMAVQTTDATLLAFAQRFAAAAVAKGVSTTVSGVAAGPVTMTFARLPVIRTGAPATYARVVQRRRKEVSALVWATTWHARAQIARSMESALRVGDKYTMPDLSIAKVVEFHGTNDMDEDSPEGFYVRRIRWLLEWTTTETYRATPVVASTTSLTSLAAGTTGTPQTLTASLL